MFRAEEMAFGHRNQLSGAGNNGGGGVGGSNGDGGCSKIGSGVVQGGGSR